MADDQPCTGNHPERLASPKQRDPLVGRAKQQPCDERRHHADREVSRVAKLTVPESQDDRCDERHAEQAQ